MEEGWKKYTEMWPPWPVQSGPTIGGQACRLTHRQKALGVTDRGVPQRGTWGENGKSLTRLRTPTISSLLHLARVLLHTGTWANAALLTLTKSDIFWQYFRPSLWPSGIGSRLGRNRLWVWFLAVSDIYPMFIEPTITWVPSGFSRYIWLDMKIVLKKIPLHEHFRVRWIKIQEPFPGAVGAWTD